MKIIFAHLGREHLGIEYLSAVLKGAGHGTALAYDPGLFGMEDNVLHIPAMERLFGRRREVVSKIEASGAGLAVFSVYTNTCRWALDIAREARAKTGIKTVFGGVHATLVPERVIMEDAADFVIAGEGEYALLELVEALSRGGDVSGIRNLWYKRGGRPHGNPVRPPIEDLDSLPFPDKEIFEGEIDYRQDYMTMTSRGCVFACSYCCECYYHKLYPSGYFRKRGVSSVIGELRAMRERYRFKRVMFFDSTFLVDKSWLEEFLPAYKKEISVPFRCEGHVKFVDPRTIALMKDAGCYGIDFGVQTLNEDIRREVLNRHESNKQIDNALSVCDNKKVRYDVDLIFGLPRMKEEDYLAPIRFMDSHRYLNRLKTYYLSFYPKLPIIEKAREAGILNAEDIGRFDRGGAGDFFHKDVIKDPLHRRWKADFERFYKLYPIIPSPVRRFIVEKRLYRFFHLVPGPVIVMFQLAMGLARGDYRFHIYITNYFKQSKKRVARAFGK